MQTRCLAASQPIAASERGGDLVSFRRLTEVLGNHR
jgi:hypothetical protein